MRYTIIGGINGVGKSTIYSSLPHADVNALGRRINVDEIVSKIGNWQDAKTQYKAGKQAVNEIKSCLASQADFHQETTLAGQSVLHTVKSAKALGYTVYLWYIFVSDVEIAKQRVRSRVMAGGHGISDEIIERRSITSLKTLKALIPLCDEVWMYNNTISYNLAAKIINGKSLVLDKGIPQEILACVM
jgi:predicted ABC-type ATPase